MTPTLQQPEAYVRRQPRVNWQLHIPDTAPVHDGLPPPTVPPMAPGGNLGRGDGSSIADVTFSLGEAGDVAEQLIPGDHDRIAPRDR